MSLSDDPLLVFSALRFHEGPSFALPILRRSIDSRLRFVQEIDERLDVVTGFKVLDGELSKATVLPTARISTIGQPQIYVFISKDEVMHVGSLAELELPLREFLSGCLDHPAVSL